MGHCCGDSPSGVDAHRPVPMPKRDERHLAGNTNAFRLAQNRHRHRRADRDRRRRHPVPAAARHRRRESRRGAAGKIALGCPDCECLRSDRLHRADLLRFLCAAHDRPRCGALSRCGAYWVHSLYIRPQLRCDRRHRRPGQAADLFRLGIKRRRDCEDRLRHRTDVLARQRLCARGRHDICAGGRERSQSVASLAQPDNRRVRPGNDCGLPPLAHATAASHRPILLENRAAEPTLDTAADRDRRFGSRRRRDHHVHIAADISLGRLRHLASGFRHGNSVRVRKPCARKSRRH